MLRLNALLFILASMSSGCVTDALWDAAGSDSLHLYRVHGIERRPDSQNVLLVTYALDHHGRQPRLYEIPLDARGLPPESLIYHGKLRAFQSIIEELEESDMEPFRQVKLTPAGRSMTAIDSS